MKLIYVLLADMCTLNICGDGYHAAALYCFGTPLEDVHAQRENSRSAYTHYQNGDLNSVSAQAKTLKP